MVAGNIMEEAVVEWCIECQEKDCVWDLYWEMDEQLTLSPQEQYKLKNKAALTFLEMHLQLQHHLEMSAHGKACSRNTVVCLVISGEI